MKYVCIDIGGTALKYAMMTEEGEVISHSQVPTRIAEDGMNVIPNKIANIAKALQNKYGKANGIAVCSPGLVDSKKGEVVFAGPIFPNYSGMKLGKEIEVLTQLPCTVENDVNAAGLGESWLGAGKGSSNVFCMFIGTGIGGALIINNRLIRGASNAAGEIGLLRIGGVHLEKLSSMSALLHRTGCLSGQEAFSRMLLGEKTFIDALNEMTKNIALGLAEISCVVNPEVIIMGGAVMIAHEDFFLPRLKTYLSRLLPSEFLDNTRITCAKLGENAGCTGALRHFLQMHDNY